MVRYSGSGSKADLDNHSNQLNTNNEEYKGVACTDAVDDCGDCDCSDDCEGCEDCNED